MTYDPATDRLASVTVAEGSAEASTTAFPEYDADGRVTQSVLPGESILPVGRVLSVGYTPLGQLETVTPPGKESIGTCNV